MARGTSLSFLAGYVDTLGFIALHGLFTAHVTGNFVLLGREVVAPGNDVLLKLLAFPAFVAGVVAVRALVRRCQGRGSEALRPAHLLQAALMLAAAASARWDMATGLLCAAAMGAQNGYGKLLLAKLPASTVMTGNVTQLVIDCLDRVGGALGGFGLIGSVAGMVAGNMKANEASTMLLMIDNRSGVQLAAAEGSAKNYDFGMFGAMFGGGGFGSAGGYTNTPEGKILVASFMDSYNNVVRAVRNYKQQEVAGGLGTGGALGVQGGSTPASQQPVAEQSQAPKAKAKKK